MIYAQISCTKTRLIRWQKIIVIIKSALMLLAFFWLSRYRVSSSLNFWSHTTMSTSQHKLKLFPLNDIPQPPPASKKKNHKIASILHLLILIVLIFQLYSNSLDKFWKTPGKVGGFLTFYVPFWYQSLVTDGQILFIQRKHSWETIKVGKILTLWEESKSKLWGGITFQWYIFKK